MQGILHGGGNHYARQLMARRAVGVLILLHALCAVRQGDGLFFDRPNGFKPPVRQVLFHRRLVACGQRFALGQHGAGSRAQQHDQAQANPLFHLMASV